MGDDKPEHFGWMKSTFWDKYNDVFFKWNNFRWSKFSWLFNY
jgi:hypothetical protein